MSNIRTLIEQLRKPGVRYGVGVWILPRKYVKQEESLSWQLNLHPLDIRNAFLDQIDPKSTFSGLASPDGYQLILNVLRKLIRERYPRDCLLIYNLELLLIGLEVNEREYFWRGALEGLPYPQTKLILTLPEEADYLFPNIHNPLFSSTVAYGDI